MKKNKADTGFQRWGEERCYLHKVVRKGISKHFFLFFLLYVFSCTPPFFILNTPLKCEFSDKE